MNKKFWIIWFLTITVIGCSTTRTIQQPPTLTKIQMKVAQLEKKVDDRDKEVEDLKFEIDELNKQLSELEQYNAPNYVEEVEAVTEVINSTTLSSTPKYAHVLRVDAPAADIQKALKNAGYYSDKVDGKLGQKSQQAIKDFQADHDLKVDGIIGRQTWGELKNYLK